MPFYKEINHRAIIVLTACFLGGSLNLFAQINLSNDKPVRGEEVSITLDDPATQVIIIYRPNSQVIKTDTILAKAPSTSFLWTPTEAGVVNIQTEAASRNVSVRFAGISWSGIFTMVVAGTLLFGGAGFAFRTLFRDEEEGGTLDLEIDHMPDT